MPTRATLVPFMLGTLGAPLAPASTPLPDGCVALDGDALGFASEVAAAGSTACVINGALGIDVLDCSAAQTPIRLATIETDAARLNLAFDGGLLLHSGARPQIAIVDLADPASPTTLAGFDLDGGLACRDLVLREDLVFAVDTLSWFYAVDLSDSAAPSELGRCELFGEQLYSLAIEGDLACVMALGFDTRAWRLYTVSIADPASPQPLGFVDIPHRFSSRDILLRGDLAIVPTFDGGAVFVDVSDPITPSITGTHPGLALDVHLDGDTAVLCGTSDDADQPGLIELLDLAAPGGPVLLGSTNLPWPSTGVTTIGDHAFVADQGRGLTVVDASDPMDPAPVAFSTVTPSRPSFIVAGDALIEGLGLLRVFDLANSIAHERTLEIVEGGVAWLEAAGELGVGCAARLGEPNRLVSIDLADPANPEPLGTAWVQELQGGAPSGLAVDAGIAAVSSREFEAFAGALELFDLTDPVVPRAAVRLTAASGTALTEVFDVVGRSVYYRDADGRLVILDATDIDNPVEAGAFTEIATIGDVTVADGIAWVVDRGKARIAAVDVSAPASPVEVGAIVPDDMGNIVRLDTRDGLLFVTDYEFGVTIYDIRAPRFPFGVGAFDPGVGSWLTRPADNAAYLFRQAAGLYALDTSRCGCPADLAPPHGVLDLADIVAFVTFFSDAHPLADLAGQDGVFDLGDIVAFVTAFNAGCPATGS